MNRLTYKDSTLPRASADGGVIKAYCDYDVREIINRLAAYEDTGLSPEECAEYAKADKEGRYIVLRDRERQGVDRLRELAKADVDNRLVVLPCKVGDIVWAFWDVPTSPRYVIYQAEVKEFRIGAKRFGSRLSVLLEPVDFRGRRKEYFENDFGKTVFLSRAEAEAALKVMEDH